MSDKKEKRTEPHNPEYDTVTGATYSDLHNKVWGELYKPPGESARKVEQTRDSLNLEDDYDYLEACSRATLISEFDDDRTEEERARQGHATLSSLSDLPLHTPEQRKYLLSKLAEGLLDVGYLGAAHKCEALGNIIEYATSPDREELQRVVLHKEHSRKPGGKGRKKSAENQNERRERAIDITANALLGFANGRGKDISFRGPGQSAVKFVDYLIGSVTHSEPDDKYFDHDAPDGIWYEPRGADFREQITHICFHNGSGPIIRYAVSTFESRIFNAAIYRVKDRLKKVNT